MGQGPRHHTSSSVSNFTTYREPRMKLLRCRCEKELSVPLHSRTDEWSKNMSGFLKNDTCLCMRVCVLWHTRHGVLCEGQETNSWSWLSPSAMWVSRTDLSLSALAPRAFTHWAIALAQKLAFLASPQLMLMLQGRDRISRTRECTGASLQLQPWGTLGPQQLSPLTAVTHVGRSLPLASYPAHQMPRIARHLQNEIWA